MIVVRPLISVVVLPGVAAVLIPWLMLGEAILFRSEALAVYVVILALVWHPFVVLWEEPSLERTFGDEYRTYRASVPRWLPRLS